MRKDANDILGIAGLGGQLLAMNWPKSALFGSMRGVNGPYLVRFPAL